MKLSELSPAEGSVRAAVPEGPGRRLRQRKDRRPRSQGPEGPLRRQDPCWL